MASTELSLIGGTLQEVNGEIVAQGWFDLEAMNALKVDDYQREVLATGTNRLKLIAAINNRKTLPPITVGMRGEGFHMNGKHVMVLDDPVYIIDGLQRIFAMKQVAENSPDRIPSLMLSAEVRFNTTKSSEKELFEEMNLRRTPISPNVILRNRRDNHPGVLTLYGISMSDKTSPIYGRVCWQQRMNRGEIFTALMIAKVALILHSHRGPHATSNVAVVPDTLDRAAEVIGLRTFRENVLTFFNLIEECWGISNIEYTQKATHTKGNFMDALALVISRHTDFWDGHHIKLTRSQVAKIRGFKVNDPEVARLAGAGNMALVILYNLIVEHYNKGKHAQGRLHPRDPQPRRVPVKPKKPSKGK